MSIPLKSDFIGAWASGLCLVHCTITPFLFVAQTCAASCCEVAPSWWRSIDLLFLLVSFVAVYRSVGNSSRGWMRYALWIAWVLLSLSVSNEYFGVFEVSEILAQSPAVSLIILHLYNRKYCACEAEACCAVS
ncbi:MerC domain-containing protein [Fulvitalea axinellae]